VIVVVGGGPAGLTAAWRSAAAGHDVTLLEAADHVGGMAASFTVAGVRVDHGSHRLHPSTDPTILTALRGLLGDALQVRPRNGRIRLHDRWVAFPLRAGDLARHLPPRFAVGAMVDTLLSPMRAAPRRDTFDEVVRSRLGATVANEFYEPYVRKLWGRSPDELSGDLARRRVGARSAGSIAHRLRLNAGHTFLYPSTGFGTIVERLADAAVAAGATLRVGMPVTAADLTATDRVRVELSDGTTVDGDWLWWTAPLALLARVARAPEPPPGGAELEHRGLALVYLARAGRPYTPFDAHYFPGAGLPLSRLSEPANYREGPDPIDRTVLCAEVPCSPGDEMWSTSDVDLGALVAASLERERLPRVAHDLVEVRRLPRVYPILTPDAAWRVAALELWGAAQPRLAVFGRQGLFVPDNTHHAIAMGWAAAACLGPDGEWDQDSWGRAVAGFRSNVVED
jgi:protoporphyrinogen oxidase